MAGHMTMPAAAPWMAQAVEALAHELRATTSRPQTTATDWPLTRAVADSLRLDPLDATEVELVAVLHDVGKLAIEQAPGLARAARRPPPRADAPPYDRGRGAARPASRASSIWRPRCGRPTRPGTAAGYPDGLSGEEIPLTARIVSVVDAYDAMTSKRAYRKPLARREAMHRLRAGAGHQFDPRVVNALLRVL